MNKLTLSVLNATLLCFVFSGTASGVQVDIATAGYKGLWTLDYGEVQRGRGLYEIEPGSHVISISGAELFFDVATNGDVTPQNEHSAVGGPGQLRLKTQTILIDPVSFEGRWQISAGATRKLIGVQNVTLVSALRFYNLALGASGAFGFDIAANGTVHVHNKLAATGGDHTLSLNNTEKFPMLRARKAARASAQ